MTDEKFDFIQDVRDKKRTARGSYNRRTHAGKSGRVKFPSDYLTKKELKAMNGEIKSYRMNSPMKWKEFKSLPDDLKITYIKALREKYQVLNTEIAKMFEIDQSCVSAEFKRLGLSDGKRGGPRSRKNFDETGWKIFTGEYVEEKVEEMAKCVDTDNITLPNLIPTDKELAEFVKATLNKNFGLTEKAASEGSMVLVGTRKDEVEFVAPESGNMHFTGTVDSIMPSVKALLGTNTYSIHITWHKTDTYEAPINPWKEIHE